MSVFFVNPFLFEAGADFESIATVTVGSGGASSIEFTSIGTDYQHLQIRGLLRTTEASASSNVSLEFNGNTTASNYTWHVLRGDGASTLGYGQTSDKVIGNIAATGANASASIFGAFVIDVLDYATSSKTRVARAFAGNDRNGSGAVVLNSLLFNNTGAVTSVKLLPPGSSNFAEYSSLALYGLKAPA